MDTICAVIVTFNRKKLLLECINSILLQTKEVKTIYIIDNASSDGTFYYLEEHGITKNPRINYIRKEENTGGAGGFKTGIELSINSDHDWIWLMDDDVEAKPAALERLLSYKNISSCIHPSREYTDGSRFHWSHTFDESIGIVTSQKDSFIHNKKWIEMKTGCFEGMLIKKDLAKSIPLPDAEFFIGCDDLLYGYHASRKTNVLYISESLLIKKLMPTAITPFRAYYELRNKIILRNKLFKIGVAKKRFAILFYVHLLMLSAYFASQMKSAKGTKAIIKSWKDGLKNKTGKTL